MRTRLQQRRQLSRKLRRRREESDLTDEAALDIRSSLGNAAVQRVLSSRPLSAIGLQREDAEEQPELPSVRVPQPMKQGHENWGVAVLQAVLNQILPPEAPVLEVDRIFGPRTDAAVRMMQWAAEIEIDGMVGDETGSSFHDAGAITEEAIEQVRSWDLLY